MKESDHTKFEVSSSIRSRVIVHANTDRRTEGPKWHSSLSHPEHWCHGTFFREYTVGRLSNQAKKKKERNEEDYADPCFVKYFNTSEISFLRVGLGVWYEGRLEDASLCFSEQDLNLGPIYADKNTIR